MVMEARLDDTRTRVAEAALSLGYTIHEAKHTQQGLLARLGEVRQAASGKPHVRGIRPHEKLLRERLRERMNRGP